MTPKRNSKTRFALLGLLTIEPMTGYEMKKFVGSTISHFWRESYSNIYPLLKKMRSEGLVSCKSHKQTGKPDRQVYHLTSKGRKEFQGWLIEPSSEELIKSELLLKLFFGSQMPVDSIEEQLCDYEGQQRQLLDTYKGAQADLASSKENNLRHTFWQMTLRRGELLAKARLKWSQECLKTIKQMG